MSEDRQCLNCDFYSLLNKFCKKNSVPREHKDYCTDFKLVKSLNKCSCNGNCSPDGCDKEDCCKKTKEEDKKDNNGCGSCSSKGCSCSGFYPISLDFDDDNDGPITYYSYHKLTIQDIQEIFNEANKN